MATTDDVSMLPASWAEVIPLVTSVVRQVLPVLGGFGFAWAKAVTGDQVTMVVTSGMVLVSLVWSVWQKMRANRALKIAAATPAGRTPPALPA